MRDTVPARVASFLAHALAGNVLDMQAALPPDVETLATSGDVFPRMLAHGYALASMPRQAIHWLTIAVGHGFINYPFLARHESSFDGLRSDPQFDGLMEVVRERWETFQP